ncbi:MAG: helix-turn-helix domain-containing protein [Lachnospiraceae bacterium]|nr:helix-turn-helix domain-containing protein [Lachnospiraceae bacterium]
MAKKAGRKGKYEYWISPDGLLRIEGWARDGLSKEQIAKNIGVRVETIIDWEKRFPQFSKALKKGREVVVRELENALIKRAKGYEVEETTEELKWNQATRKQELMVTKRVKKHIAPDTGALAFALKNYAPDKWRDRKDVEISGQLDTNPFAELTEEQLRKLAKDNG